MLKVMTPIHRVNSEPIFFHGPIPAFLVCPLELSILFLRILIETNEHVSGLLKENSEAGNELFRCYSGGTKRCLEATDIRASPRENHGFATRVDSNRPAQPRKLARILKFRI